MIYRILNRDRSEGLFLDASAETMLKQLNWRGQRTGV
jgi:hypothetical protein